MSKPLDELTDAELDAMIVDIRSIIEAIKINELYADNKAVEMIKHTNLLGQAVGEYVSRKKIYTLCGNNATDRREPITRMDRCSTVNKRSTIQWIMDTLRNRG